MWTVSRIRQHFLDYFARHDHRIIPSSPLVPRHDPSLLFTAAGMVQFKNYFTGAESPPYSRVATAQKCVRAGGKHNDLENVGYTARHHTFFEMLGNFSFGDYFKEKAIELAWQLVTQEFGLSPERLLVTVHADDEEAATLWRKISGIPDTKIIRIASSDNFWAMGDTGPCGPCSEIFYDHGAHIPGGPPGSPDADSDRFVEIWNLVFMQYEQLAAKDGEESRRIALPKPSIDTGSGLERLAAVLQGVHSNYDIDLFQHLIHASVEVSGVKAEGQALVSHRVISDHLRTCCFLIADGVHPSNEGRGYVLRRIMRRAMRHAYMLGCREPLMYQLVPAVISVMGDHYTELLRAQTLITETLRLEEERFRDTLGRGLSLLAEESRHLAVGASLPGDIAFKLYDTYGFPVDLTADILRSEGRTVDIDGFHAAMAKQKAESRAHWAGSGEEKIDPLWLELREQCTATEFLGYDATTAEGLIQALVKDGQLCSHVAEGDQAFLLTNQTPFYAESGGQMGDTGLMTSQKGSQAEVLDTVKKANDLFVHRIKVTSGDFTVGDMVHLAVDAERRQLLRANHSATHLLHATLRKHLGNQVVQKGSLVAPDRLRFDFSYHGAVDAEKLQAIEDEVNALIRLNTETETHLMTPEEAFKTGAVALFGEKYGEEVRVVKMGGHDQQHPYSIEFCGGTHVSRTGDIGLFKIISETGIAAGIRRIEAVTGPVAERYVQTKEHLIKSLNLLLKTTDETLPLRIQQTLEEKRRLEREVKKLQMKLASHSPVSDSHQDADGPHIIAGITLMTRRLDDVPAKELKAIADQLKQQLKSGVVVLGSAMEGKASLVVAVTADLTDRLNAIDLVKIGAMALGGSGGGGRADMAQAGGPNVSALPQSFLAIEQALIQLNKRL
jgi:alanyl-tRNA synthetase